MTGNAGAVLHGELTSGGASHAEPDVGFVNRGGALVGWKISKGKTCWSYTWVPHGECIKSHREVAIGGTATGQYCPSGRGRR